MIAEIGHFALVLALAVSLFQGTVPLFGVRAGDVRLMETANTTSFAVFGFVLVAFLALTAAYVQSDFSVENVYQNSHSAKPLIYKISGVWGNHEGSMVLWILILVLFSALVAAYGANLPTELRTTVLSVQSWVTAAFLLFVLMTSNPFNRIVPAPFEGNDLNPLLQDIGLAAHPPLLYLGYVGYSITFSFAVAALILGRIDAAWARWVRPWALTAWIFLTLGIAMGSYWAYYELGWGGWWFWDPVENASFMPWLAGTALLHSAIVMEKREALKVWTVLLAILAFALSLLGTFIVRSGLLTSVHAFATDPSRGLFILMILVVFVGGAFSLFAWRASLLRQGGLFAPVSREGALVLNNLFLTVSCAAVLVGTLYPPLLEVVTGERISVGPPFFNATFIPLTLPLLLLMPFGPFLSWKRGDLLGVTQRLWGAAVISAFIALALASVAQRGPWLAVLALGLGIWLIFGSFAEIAHRTKLLKTPLSISWRRAKGLPRSAWGTALAHAGVGVMVLGVVGETAWKDEHIDIMRVGDTAKIAHHEVTLSAIAPNTGPNYQEDVAIFSVLTPWGHVREVTASKRFYPARRMPTTEAGMIERFHGDLYVTLGDPQENGGIVVRIFYKPLVNLIWIGSIIMAIGGFVSLSDRRLRVGAPTPAKRRAKQALAPAE
ncbi:MAG: heme lyase CcmF/NrfE family subunit [Pseudomonadota bacterium]